MENVGFIDEIRRNLSSSNKRGSSITILYTNSKFLRLADSSTRGSR